MADKMNGFAERFAEKHGDAIAPVLFGKAGRAVAGIIAVVCAACSVGTIAAIAHTSQDLALCASFAALEAEAALFAAVVLAFGLAAKSLEGRKKCDRAGLLELSNALAADPSTEEAAESIREMCGA